MIDISVIYLSTSTCGPCLQYFPKVKQKCDTVHANVSKVVLDQVTAAEKQRYIEKYGVRQVPTLLVFKSGVVQAVITGTNAEAEQKLNEVLGI